MKTDSAKILFQAFLHCEQFRHGQGYPRFDVVHPALIPLRPWRRPPSKGAMKHSFQEVVVACSMPEPCKFPSFDSCQKRFLWTHKEIDLAPHLVFGLVLQVGDAGMFPQALGFKTLIPFLGSASRVHVSQP